MKRMHSNFGGFLTASALAAVLAACAGSQSGTSQAASDDQDYSAVDTGAYPGNVGDAGHRSDESRREARVDTSTIYDEDYSGTGVESGTGIGGSGEPLPGAPVDPTLSDTAGEYGDPNAWPTGPLPSDTGVGGAGSPLEDTVWMDTLEPGDTLIVPDASMPGSTGPDVW